MIARPCITRVHGGCALCWPWDQFNGRTISSSSPPRGPIMLCTEIMLARASTLACLLATTAAAPKLSAVASSSFNETTAPDKCKGPDGAGTCPISRPHFVDCSFVGQGDYACCPPNPKHYPCRNIPCPGCPGGEGGCTGCPAPTYVCQSSSGQCVLGAGGLPLPGCEQACSPPQNYTCQNGACVASARGLPIAGCTQACGGPPGPPAPSPCTTVLQALKAVSETVILLHPL